MEVEAEAEYCEVLKISLPILHILSQLALVEQVEHQVLPLAAMETLPCSIPIPQIKAEEAAILVTELD
jgi:hypothetical protein